MGGRMNLAVVASCVSMALAAGCGRSNPSDGTRQAATSSTPTVDSSVPIEDAEPVPDADPPTGSLSEATPPTILVPGAEPSVVAAYRLTAVDRSLVQVATTKRSSTPSSSQERAFSMLLSARSVGVSSGNALIEVRVESLTAHVVRDGVEMPANESEDYPGLQGAVATLVVAPDGRFALSELDPAGDEDGPSRPSVEEALLPVLLSRIQFPTTPIGSGASWEEHRDREDRVVPTLSSRLVVQTQLNAIEGSVLTVHRQRTLSGEQDTFNATVDAVVDLTQVWPRAATINETRTSRLHDDEPPYETIRSSTITPAHT